jgi:hypothetical protein
MPMTESGDDSPGGAGAFENEPILLEFPSLTFGVATLVDIIRRSFLLFVRFAPNIRRAGLYFKAAVFKP